MDGSPTSLGSDKTAQCSRCKRFFASGGFLRRHIRVAHGDRFVNEIKAAEPTGTAAPTPGVISDDRFFRLLGITLSARQCAVLTQLDKEAA